MSVHLAPVETGEHVLMKKMDFAASVLKALSPLTVTPRWMNVAAAHVSMAPAERIQMDTVVTVNLDGLARTVTWTGMTVYQVLVKMLEHALTSSMVLPASVARVSEVTSAR